MKDWEVKTWKDFVRVHEDAHEALTWHLKHKHFKGTDKDRKRLLKQLRQSNSPLEANNILGRIKFARIWQDHGLTFGGPEKCYFVTIALEKFALSFEDAKSFDLRSIQGWVRQKMMGFNFIGNVEIAPYTNWNHFKTRGPVNSIHVHLVVAGGDQRELKQRIAVINEKFDSLLPGRDAARMKVVRKGTLSRVLLYCVKAPTFEYRAFPGREERSNRRTGEIQKFLTGRWHQRKSEASHRVHLRVREIMKDWRLDDIMFGSGTGTAVIRRIRGEARKLALRETRRKQQINSDDALEIDV